jgi:hypothetical protein
MYFDKNLLDYLAFSFSVPIDMAQKWLNLNSYPKLCLPPSLLPFLPPFLPSFRPFSLSTEI